MKKLALALMCLVSVAFFASCQKPVENPEPSIAVMTGENFVYDGQTVDLGVTYSIGFRAASNTQTGKELAKFNLNASLYETDGTLITSNDSTQNISGTEFVFQNDNLVFEHNVRELVGKAIFTATITDVDGKTNSVTINLNINQPAQNLLARPIEWVRKGNDLQGNTETEMANCGLQWTGSYKDIMATIRPLDGAALYVCDGEDYEKITTDVEKAAYFANLVESGETVDKYRNITTNNSANYNDMLAVIYQGETYLIHITRAEIATGNYGTQITIKGETK
jgi:hypothetical protein